MTKYQWTVNETVNLVIHEFIVFWERARIPTNSLPDCEETCKFLLSVGGAAKKLWEIPRCLKAWWGRLSGEIG